MSNTEHCIGKVISDEETPSFETIRIKLESGQDVKPGTLVRISVPGGVDCKLIARIHSAHEHNPNEGPEDINVRDTMKIPSNYPPEEDSTIIYRLAEAELIEETINGTMQKPQTLPRSGAEVFIATEDEIVKTLGLEDDEKDGLQIGDTVAGATTEIILKREAIQRHIFLCGTTGSGKSYAMGVIAEELVKHRLPIIFIDTQDEYSKLVKKLKGTSVEPGEDDFTIAVSSFTEPELLELLPRSMTSVHTDIVGKAFSDLKEQIASNVDEKFTIDQLLQQMPTAGNDLSAGDSSITMAQRRTATLRHKIFGAGIDTDNWKKYMYPCLAINCKDLTTTQVQTFTTAVLRELQGLRYRKLIPPYVAVIDEAHLFVPEGEGSACKQIIREGVRMGRHHGISIILMTQSPVDIDKRAIRQCNTRLVFALEPDQLDAIKGVRADASDEMLNALPKMPRGTCILSGTYENVKHAIPVKIRERETENSEGGATPDIFAEMKNEWLDELKQGEANGT